MPRKVRFADEKAHIATRVRHQQLSPEVQQEHEPTIIVIANNPDRRNDPVFPTSSQSTIIANNPDRRNDHIADVVKGAIIAQQRAEEAMMRAREIQSTVRRRNEVLHYVVECENRQLHKKPTKQARQALEEACNDADLMSVSKAWISEIFHGIQMK